MGGGDWDVLFYVLFFPVLFCSFLLCSVMFFWFHLFCQLLTLYKCSCTDTPGQTNFPSYDNKLSMFHCIWLTWVCKKLFILSIILHSRDKSCEQIKNHQHQLQEVFHTPPLECRSFRCIDTKYSTTTTLRCYCYNLGNSWFISHGGRLQISTSWMVSLIPENINTPRPTLACIDAYPGSLKPVGIK